MRPNGLLLFSEKGGSRRLTRDTPRLTRFLPQPKIREFRSGFIAPGVDSACGAVFVGGGVAEG